MIQRCSASLKFGIAFCFSFRTAGTDPYPGPGSTTLPSSIPLVDAPLFVLDLLPNWSLPCHVPNERHCSVVGPDAPITGSSSLEGVYTGSFVRFSIPKVNGFDTELMRGWEVVALRLFQYSTSSEQFTVSALSFMLVIGSGVGLVRQLLHLENADWRWRDG